METNLTHVLICLCTVISCLSKGQKLPFLAQAKFPLPQNTPHMILYIYSSMFGGNFLAPTRQKLGTAMHLLCIPPSSLKQSLFSTVRTSPFPPIEGIASPSSHVLHARAWPHRPQAARGPNAGVANGRMYVCQVPVM